MKILVAVDGSACSHVALDEVGDRPWPKGSEVLVLCVAVPPPYVEEPLLLGGAAYGRLLETKARSATRLAARAAKRLVDRAPALRISHRALVGLPATRILEEARRWRADLVVLGSHGRGTAARIFLGSVSNVVALRAPCSVEIVRRATRQPAGRSTARSRRG